MRRCAFVVLLALLATTSASARAPRHGRVVLEGTIGPSARVLTSPEKQPQVSGIYGDAYVNGHRLRGSYQDGTVYMVGRSTLVQWPPSASGTDFMVRAVRSVPTLAHLRVVFRW